MSLVVLVCGGRDYVDQARVNFVLDELHAGGPIARIVHGGARGADTCARAWAFVRRVTAVSYPADWHRYGSAAGPMRNGVMLRKETPDLVLAFPGGKGTADMVTRARAAGVQVMEVTP